VINDKAVHAANVIRSMYLLIMVDTLLLRPSLHFTPLHSTSLHLLTLHFLSFKLQPTTLHYPLIWLNPICISYRPISSHITTLHLTSLHCAFRLFSPHFYSFHFTSFIIAFPTRFQKILGLHWNVPNAASGIWFQFLMVLFTKKYFPLSEEYFPLPSL